MTIPSLGIRPKSYGYSTEPTPRISSFYEKEYQTLTFGEYTGRPSDFIDFHKSDLVYFLAEGWKVDSVLAKGEGGKWIVEAKAVSSQKGKVTESYNPVTTGVGATANNQEGGPYWFVWSKIKLVRKRLQGDKVTDYLMARLASSYNEGRKLNSDRYDELCRLYAAMLSSTQNVASGSNVGVNIDGAFYSLEQSLVDRMRSVALPSVEELSDITERVDARTVQWLTSREEDINRQFDARMEQAKSQMVSNGTYNSVVWPSVVAGIERERQVALNNLAASMRDLEAGLAQIKGEAFSRKMQLAETARKTELDIADMRAKLKESRIKVISEVVNNKINLANLRNQAAQALVSFMERREDDYPDLETILNVVTRVDNESVSPGHGIDTSGKGHNTQTVLPDPDLPTLPSL